jgi:hypothetical protein
MTMLNEDRADYQSFPVGLAAVLRTLTHDRTAMLRYVAVRLNVTDARQLPRDSKQRWIKVQRWNDSRREAWTLVRARQRTADVSLMPTPSLKSVAGKISGSITDLNGIVKSTVQKPHEADKYRMLCWARAGTLNPLDKPSLL